MRTDHLCRWVRFRLPLLVGGELGIEERRRVERHLIGCLGCRDHREASTDALSVLHSVAQVSLSTPDAPSLWPALSAQIRQSRHAAPRPSWWEGFALPRPLAAFGLALGFGGVLVFSLARPVRRAEAPISTVKVETPTIKSNLAASSPRTAPSNRSSVLTQSGGNPFESPSSALPLNYDLDHGTPMGPGNLDPQRTF